MRLVTKLLFKDLVSPFFDFFDFFFIGKYNTCKKSVDMDV